MSLFDRYICAANAADLAGFTHLAAAFVELARREQS